MKRLAAATLWVSLTVACSTPVPAHPTYFADVQPLLAAQCTRCHGASPSEPKIASFRLDRYVKNDEQTLDVWDYREALIQAAVEERTPAMPPDLPLSEREKAVLERWFDQGAPKGTRENHLPTLELFSVSPDAQSVDQTLSVSFRASDPDGDGLAVAIGVRPVGGTGGDLLVSNLGQGLREVTVDTGMPTSQQEYELYAVLDDGYFDDVQENAHEQILVDRFYVDHGSRGTAPSVQLIAPNGGQTLIGSSDITWAASDPDPGDALTINLDLVRVESDGTESITAPIAHGLSNASSSYAWNPTGIPTNDATGPLRYKIQVTAADTGAKNVRSDRSDSAFTLAAPVASTQYTWADVKPILVTYCVECHGQPAKTPGLEDFRLDKYDATDPEAPVNGDPGVYELRSLVYQRMVEAKNMPPSAEPQPTQAQLSLVGEWILAGAPLGSGPGDAKPVFTWTVPNNAAITKVSTSAVTLQFKATDAEGALKSGSLSVAKINANSDQSANCGTQTTGWAAIAGVNLSAGSFGWTAPAEGYYCFKGEITDSADQTTTAIAGRPVKYSTKPGP